ncbi:MAG: chemotaxis response regulator protein-glutamate methylesterase [Puniceicoccaceae bacterium]
MISRKIRVLVVDDSAVVRRLIPEALKNDRDIEVVGTAQDPYHARDLILELEPDILTLDIEMPRMDGLTFLNILMEKHPMPVIVLSSLTRRGSEQALEALRLGAVDVLGKPRGSFSLGETGQVLGDRIRGAMEAQMDNHLSRDANGGNGISPVHSVLHPGSGQRVKWDPRQIGLIGASTGGTEAIKMVLASLPANFPGLCIVQHIPAFISKAFAERVNSASAMEVREARHGDVLREGLALIAPGDYHLSLQRERGYYRVSLKQSPKVWYQRPAADVLFRSAAPITGKWAVGALLTGMGRDGAEGLLQIKEAGGHTLAQDEATSVVYGMPRVANEIGAVEEVVPLQQVAGRMTKAFLKQMAH